MKSKIFATLVAIILFLFTCSVCFAETKSTESTNLGNTITSEIKKSALADAETNNAKDDSKDVENAIEDGVDDTKNTADDAGDDAKNEIDDSTNKIENDTNSTKNSVSGETTNFSSGEALDDTTDTGMTTGTWIWIILAVIAVIIVACIWYYAATSRNNE